MRRWLWMVLALAACGTSGGAQRPEVPRGPDEGEPHLTRLTETPPTGEGWLAAWFTHDGFPAVSTDGRYVVMARELTDSARGFPNLRVEVWSVDDGKRVFESVILDADGGGVDYDLAEPLPAATVKAANAAYDKAASFLGAHRWVSLKPYVETPPVDMDRPDMPSVSDDRKVIFQYSEPTLRVDYASANKSLERDVHEWSTTPDYTPCGPSKEDWYEGCACQDPAYASGFYVDEARDVLLVQVDYFGNDTCWEPETGYHPMRLPKAGARGWREATRSAETMRLADVWAEIEGEAARAQEFIDVWGARFPDAPEVKAARALLGP